MMPSRIIRESCTTSHTLDGVSPEAERMFWRLTTVADDHGRFDADPRVLLARCFPLRIGVLTPKEVALWVSEMERASLVVLYAVNGREYGYFPTWTKHQRIRATRSKFPDPPHVAANGGKSPQAAAYSEGMGDRNEGKEKEIRQRGAAAQAGKYARIIEG